AKAPNASVVGRFIVFIISPILLRFPIIRILLLGLRGSEAANLPGWEQEDIARSGEVSGREDRRSRPAGNPASMEGDSPARAPVSQTSSHCTSGESKPLI